ncbi:MAG: TlpA family protein disulfide reductase, partial [Bacteroidales bacterium]
YKPTWKQYMAADAGKDIGTKYMISGIPNFMLIDKNQKLVSFTAPRPSDEETYDLIRKNL